MYGQSMGWSIEDHGTYYIIKCIVEEPEHPHINYSKADGVIGRRGMNLKEQVPKVLRAYTERKDGEHHWKQWSVLTRKFKALRPHLFYHVSDQSDPLFSKEICAYGLTQVERDVLQKYVPKVWLEETEI
ncbi:hypothetical protein ACFQDF_00465 [Ectobacillus funiculus]